MKNIFFKKPDNVECWKLHRSSKHEDTPRRWMLHKQEQGVARRAAPRHFLFGSFSVITCRYLASFLYKNKHFLYRIVIQIHSSPRLRSVSTNLPSPPRTRPSSPHRSFSRAFRAIPGNSAQSPHDSHPHITASRNRHRGHSAYSASMPNLFLTLNPKSFASQPPAPCSSHACSSRRRRRSRPKEPAPSSRPPPPPPPLAAPLPNLDSRKPPHPQNTVPSRKVSRADHSRGIDSRGFLRYHNEACHERGSLERKFVAIHTFEMCHAELTHALTHALTHQRHTYVRCKPIEWS